MQANTHYYKINHHCNIINDLNNICATEVNV